MKISRATCYRGNYDTSIQCNTADTASPERATFASPATATTKILKNIQSDETKTLFFHQDAPTPQTHDCGRLPATNMVTESDSLRRFSWVRNIRLGADEQEFPPEWRVAATGWGNTCTPPVHAARLRSDFHQCVVSRRLCLCNSFKKKRIISLSTMLNYLHTLAAVFALPHLL